MPLPHALESLLSILVALRQDNASDIGLSSSLSLRQSYATALIRLVNGLVDPLQSGTYARSILSIAAQIGLPAWLVELRHAATHEDLPSLELLRDGAKESLTWLLHNYFLPTLNPSSAQVQAHSASIRPVEPLLRRYKNLLKTVSRDASLRARHAADIAGVLREIERWLAEARLSAAVHSHSHVHASEFTSSLSYRGRHAAGEPVVVAVVDNGEDEDGGDGDDEEPEPREAWALDRLCDALLVKGALVPISRKKRVSSKGSPHHPPSSLLVIWIPLLESVAAEHAHFPAVLTSRVITHLLSEDDNPPTDEPESDPDDNTNATTATATATATEKASYDVCLANWATWLIEWRRSADETDSDVTARRQSVFFQLAQALVNPNHKREREETSRSPKSQTQIGARALLNALCASDRRLAGISDVISGVDKRRVSEENDAPGWCEADLDVMEARVKAARSLSAPRGDVEAIPVFPPAEQVFLSQKKSLPNGWRLLSEQGGWQPCPIGVYI